MLGSIIGLATLKAMSEYNPTHMSNTNMFIMGFSPLAGGAAGDVLRYEAPTGGGIYREGWGGMFRSNQAGGKNIFESAGSDPIKGQFKAAGSNNFVDIDDIRVHAPKGATAMAFSAIGPVLSSYYLYQGAKENGFEGLTDAYFYEMGTSSAMFSEMYKTKKVMEGGKKFIQTERRLGFFGGFPAGIGGAIGYQLGESLFGVPGGFAGASVGASIGAAAARHPYIGIAAATIGTAAYAAGSFATRTAGEIIKIGAARGARRNSIDTAGDTSSFFTQNAITTRGRAFDAMRKSHLNARSALGMEASMTHMNRSFY